MENRKRFLNTITDFPRPGQARCPPHVQTLVISTSQGPFNYGDLALPRAAFVMDEVLLCGFFVLHRGWICQVRSVALHRNFFG